MKNFGYSLLWIIKFRLQDKNLVCQNNLPYELLSEAFAFSYDDTGSTKQFYVKNKIFIRECNIYDDQIAMTANVTNADA